MSGEKFVFAAAFPGTSRRQMRSSWLSSARWMIPTVWGNVPKGQKGKASFKNGGQAALLNKGID